VIHYCDIDYCILRRSLHASLYPDRAKLSAAGHQIIDDASVVDKIVNRLSAGTGIGYSTQKSNVGTRVASENVTANECVIDDVGCANRPPCAADDVEYDTGGALG